MRDITEQIWNQHRFEEIPKFYADDYMVDYRPYSPIRHGRDAVRGMVERALAAFPDYHEELHELVAEGDMVVARLTLSSTRPHSSDPA